MVALLRDFHVSEAFEECIKKEVMETVLAVPWPMGSSHGCDLILRCLVFAPHGSTGFVLPWCLMILI